MLSLNLTKCMKCYFITKLLQALHWLKISQQPTATVAISKGNASQWQALGGESCSADSRYASSRDLSSECQRESVDGFVPKLDLCATVSCLAPYCCNELFLYGRSQKFLRDMQAHIESVFSLIISQLYHIFDKQANQQNFSMEVSPCH